MPDFTTIIPADLLPEAVREYQTRYCPPYAWQFADIVLADAAIAAALELAASLMVCGTCKHADVRDWMCFSNGRANRPTLDLASLHDACHYTPSRWHHYRDYS